MIDPIALRARLDADLLFARKARDAVVTAALRSLLAELDNASAVPIETAPGAVYGHSADVPRKELSIEDCKRIFEREARSRLDASAEYERLGRLEDAARLRAESAVIDRYIGL